MSDDVGDEKIVDAQLLKKNGQKPKDSRDSLLYSVTETTPPPTKLGLFRLGPSAACGDLITAPLPTRDSKEDVEQTFVIKRVSYIYNYVGGSYKMTRKAAAVKRADRDGQEEFLRRLYDNAEGQDMI